MARQGKASQQRASSSIHPHDRPPGARQRLPPLPPSVPPPASASSCGISTTHRGWIGEFCRLPFGINHVHTKGMVRMGMCSFSRLPSLTDSGAKRTLPMQERGAICPWRWDTVRAGSRGAGLGCSWNRGREHVVSCHVLYHRRQESAIISHHVVSRPAAHEARPSRNRSERAAGLIPSPDAKAVQPPSQPY